MSKRHVFTGSAWIIFLLAQVGMGLAMPVRPVSAAGGNHIYVAPNIGAVTTCTEADPCSLSQGMATAGNGDTIHMAAGTYPDSSNRKISAGITLMGPDFAPGSEPTAVLDGYDHVRVLDVDASGLTVNLINLVVQNGKVTDVDGAGIYCHNSTTLSLDHVIVRNNDLVKDTASGKHGGGIYSLNCTLSINNSIISGNAAAGWGGGLALSGGNNAVNNTLITGNSTSGNAGGGVTVSGGTTLFDQVTISANTTSAGGGGLFVNATTGSFTMQNSTVSGNTSEGSGGGLNLYNAATIINSTFSGNHSNNAGGAVYLSGTTGSGDPTAQGILTINHVTIADNTASTGSNIHFGVAGSKLYPDNSIVSMPVGSTKKNCTGEVNVLDPDYNISSDNSCWWLELNGTDKFNTDPLLGPLQDNGGPTQTRALLKGSPAIDYSPDPGVGDPTHDQRGFAYNGRPDVGAYEVLLPPVIQLYTQIMPPFRVGQEAPVYIQILNPNGDPSIQTELSFSLTLPQNLVFADPVVHPGSSDCGTITAAPGERIAVISGGANTLFSPVTNCHLSLDVRAVAIGNGAVTATGVSSKETWTGAPPDSLDFTIAPPFIYIPIVKGP